MGASPKWYKIHEIDLAEQVYLITNVKDLNGPTNRWDIWITPFLKMAGNAGRVARDDKEGGGDEASASKDGSKQE